MRSDPISSDPLRADLIFPSHSGPTRRPASASRETPAQIASSYPSPTFLSVERTIRRTVPEILIPSAHARAETARHKVDCVFACVQIRQALSAEEKLLLLVAAAAHDVAHPGLMTSFLKRSRHLLVRLASVCNDLLVFDVPPDCTKPSHIRSLNNHEFC